MKHWNVSEISTLKDLYPIYGAEYTSLMLGKSKISIIKQANRLGLFDLCWRSRLSESSKTINAKYFEQDWDRQMAWLVGYIHSDANIVDHAIQLDCSQIDEELIYKAREILDSKHKVTVTDEYVDKKGVYHGKSTRCAFTNMILVKSLFAKSGLASGKSEIDNLLPNTLPTNLYFHYLRGYFDGDGWVNPKDRSFGFTGTYNFLDQVRNLFRLNGLNKFPKIEKNGNSKFNFKIRWYSLHDWKLFHKLIYNNHQNLYLNRKKILFEQRLTSPN